MVSCAWQAVIHYSKRLNSTQPCLSLLQSIFNTVWVVFLYPVKFYSWFSRIWAWHATCPCWHLSSLAASNSQINLCQNTVEFDWTCSHWRQQQNIWEEFSPAFQNLIGWLFIRLDWFAWPCWPLLLDTITVPSGKSIIFHWWSFKQPCILIQAINVWL